MALFKNLYLDFGFLSPFKKKNAPLTNQPIQMPALQKAPQVPLPPRNFRELPQVPRKLIDESAADIAKLELPQIRKAVVQPPPIASLPLASIPAAEVPVAMPQIVAPPIVREPSVQQKQESLPDNPVPAAQAKPIDPVIGQDGPYTGKVEDSFFSSLITNISKDEASLCSNTDAPVLNRDLFEDMQHFWKEKKDQLGALALNKGIREDLAKKITELQQLEIEWQKLQLQQENLRDTLASKEILIENNIKHLKRSFKKLRFSAEVSPQHFFLLHGGGTLKSLQDLQDSLRSIDDAIFQYHVRDGKNDFSCWVRDVMGLKDLADRVAQAVTRESLHQVIDDWYHSA